MALTPIETFEVHVLKRLSRAPDWSQRFPRLKPVLDRLVSEGAIRRRPAAGAKVPLMVEITEAGRAKLERLNRKDSRA